jgi:hypothetical protein
MKKNLFWIWIAVFLVPGAALAATLQNTDQQSYQLAIRPFDGPSSYYTIIENAQVEICFNGCEMTLLSTGQTVRVNSKDAVVIDSGVMSVTSGD